ncbi:hypothetical protein ES288_D12G104200v1 [Gossypium darwinii]|uniref:Uncharacterized protein n=1 Tax=Gossypium darwinii TaxID=34276 RepID=A0A5D2A873_GOSDA|nr:hypothetical protein ES288_D12G104200v1 [Gossypium darwinii]
MSMKIPQVLLQVKLKRRKWIPARFMLKILYLLAAMQTLMPRKMKVKIVRVRVRGKRRERSEDGKERKES